MSSDKICISTFLTTYTDVRVYMIFLENSEKAIMYVVTITMKRLYFTIFCIFRCLECPKCLTHTHVTMFLLYRMTDEDTDINTENRSEQQQQRHSIGNNTGILQITGTKDISLDAISSNLQCQYSGSREI